jgi:hypothetical protein
MCVCVHKGVNPITAGLETLRLFCMLYKNKDNWRVRYFYSNFVPISITVNFILYPTSQSIQHVSIQIH